MSSANDYSQMRGAVAQDETHDYTAILARCQDTSTWFAPQQQIDVRDDDEGIRLECECGWKHFLGYTPTVDELWSAASAHRSGRPR